MVTKTWMLLHEENCKILHDKKFCSESVQFSVLQQYYGIATPLRQI